MLPYFTNYTTQVMGHRRRQNNLQQRVNSAKRKSNNELRNAISAMQLQFHVLDDHMTIGFAQNHLRCGRNVESELGGSYIRALHATHLLGHVTLTDPAGSRTKALSV